MSNIILLMHSAESKQMLITNSSGTEVVLYSYGLWGSQLLQSAGQGSVQSLHHEVQITMNFGTI